MIQWHFGDLLQFYPVLAVFMLANCITRLLSLVGLTLTYMLYKLVQLHVVSDFMSLILDDWVFV